MALLCVLLLLADGVGGWWFVVGDRFDGASSSLLMFERQNWNDQQALKNRGSTFFSLCKSTPSRCVRNVRTPELLLLRGLRGRQPFL